jgi:hypothetical protein
MSKLYILHYNIIMQYCKITIKNIKNEKIFKTIGTSNNNSHDTGGIYSNNRH